MLSKLIAPLLSGQYDFKLAVFQMPVALVEALLHDTRLQLAQDDLPDDVPRPDEGNAWVLVEAGKQYGTGMPFPGGRADFFEAKLEIPFLRHPDCAQLLMIKHTVLFNTHMHTISSKQIAGLRSQRCLFVDTKNLYSADGVLVLDESKGASQDAVEWDQAHAARIIRSYWVGHKTGKSASKFNMDDLAAPSKGLNAQVHLHLPSFFDGGVSSQAYQKASQDTAVQALLTSGSSQGEGWIQARASTWKFSVKHSTQMAELASI